MNTDVEDQFCLDEARETLFILQRACERYATVLGNVVENLNSKKPDDEWLLEVLDEASKGIVFHQQQLTSFTGFHARANAYVEAVRNEAHQLALQELAGNAQGQEEAGRDVAASTSVAGVPPRPKSSKTVHPELLKFKLEKQAKILGKYGGIPALGAGLVLPRLQRESILKATGSAAAREIHYSKVENKDASNLAEVMRFKVRKSEEGGPTTAPSPWQAEVSAKKGKTALDGTDQKDQVTPSTRSYAVYGEELGSVLQQRQAALEDALQAGRTKTPLPAGPQISGDAMDELAEKLRRRQSAAKQMEEAASAAEAEAEEAAATPATPSWSNAAAPFGGELAATLQRRAEQRRLAEAEATAAASAGPSGSHRPSAPELTPAPTKAAMSGSAAIPATPASVPGLAPGTARRSTMPPTSLASMMATPPASTNELQEKLRRRLSALDGQQQALAQPVGASEAQ